MWIFYRKNSKLLVSMASLATSSPLVKMQTVWMILSAPPAANARCKGEFFHSFEKSQHKSNKQNTVERSRQANCWNKFKCVAKIRSRKEMKKWKQIVLFISVQATGIFDNFRRWAITCVSDADRSYWLAFIVPLLHAFFNEKLISLHGCSLFSKCFEVYSRLPLLDAIYWKIWKSSFSLLEYHRVIKRIPSNLIHSMQSSVSNSSCS